MRIMLHIIIWITNFYNIASLHSHEVLAWAGRLHYIHLHELGIRLGFHIYFCQFISLNDVLFTFCGIASAITDIFPFHYLSKLHVSLSDANTLACFRWLSTPHCKNFQHLIYSIIYNLLYQTTN